MEQENAIYFCQKCKDEQRGIIEIYNSKDVCSKHNIPIPKIKTNINVKEYWTILSISHDISFIEAMIKLKQDNIIEYESRMAQFRSQKQQQTAQQQAAQPHCPHCQSTNIAKIDTLERAGSIMFWGIFSKKINKSFKCKNCGYTW